MDSNLNVKGEYYVTMPYNLMIRDNLKVKHFLSNNYVCLGTPMDVEIIDSCLSLYSKLQNYSPDYSKIISYFGKNMA